MKINEKQILKLDGTNSSVKYQSTQTNINTDLIKSDSNQSNNNIDNTSKVEQLTNINIKSTTFINDVLIYDEVISNKSIDTIRDSECFDDNITTDICTQLPLFFINRNIIKIPTKIEYVIKRFIPKKLLNAIHENEDVARELCLLFTTQLTSTYFEIQDNPESEGWKSLHAKYLREFLSLSPNTYKDVRTALEHPTNRGAIIECDHKHIEGEKNFFYRFGEAYIGKGMVSYHLQTKEAKRLLNKHFIRISGKSQSNRIVQNLIQFYEDISLPTIDQIWKEGDRLRKSNYKTKKGKLLKKLGHHSKSEFKDPQKYSFIEDSIKIFNYLTEDGLMFPEVGSEKSGGRIIDSITLMPSWIRNMIKIKDEANVEADYSCLHPNSAINLYGGSKEYLTHSDLGLEMNIDVSDIKLEHLSFFNKEVWQMKKSPLFKYYQKNEPNMLQNIITEKHSSEFKHKITSRRLMTKEVEIMTEVVEILNEDFIYVGYVYDALICHPRDANRVKEVMDSIILKQGIKTSAKLSNGDGEAVESSEIKPALNEPKSISSDVVDDKKYIRVYAKLINNQDGIRSLVLEKINNGDEVVFEDAIIVFASGEIIYDRVLRVHDRINPELIYVLESHIINPLAS
ncbi:MAG: hypothetical protein HKP59_10590 [Lutibacter sp.]|uniref:hypothetical protein n=1 Tax=Lutibacter sp. TaxID=1925666 RepID=UPI00181FAF65|nr:hypothetical protein [Lutibacter sp.]MBT8318060.1 hypothetical protein [Lutibacter sp.]NNJ58920.1 hypothetical protein [Lutibacter sp.]